MGATGRDVALNLKRIRTAAGLTQAELSARISDLGYKILPASIGKIETQDRRVEVDDLMVLAVALDVSPLGLMMPWTSRPTDTVELTAHSGHVLAYDVWRWAMGSVPIETREQYEDALSDVGVFRDHSVPAWMQVTTSSPAYDALYRS